LNVDCAPGVCVSFTFNGSGRCGLTANERVAKAAGVTTARLFYDGRSTLVAEAAGSARRDYISVAGIPLAVADGASVAFVTADALGALRAVISSTGAVIWSRL
jgi:hypothetical protein